MTYHPIMVRRVLVACAATMLGVALLPAAVSAAETDPAPCAFTLSAPRVVQVSGRDVVTATVQAAACGAGAETISSVACIQMQGSQTAEQCDVGEGILTAQVFYAPYRPGATYTATGRGCVLTGNPPQSNCQSTGPLTATL